MNLLFSDYLTLSAYFPGLLMLSLFAISESFGSSTITYPVQSSESMVLAQLGQVLDSVMKLQFRHAFKTYPPSWTH